LISRVESDHPYKAASVSNYRVTFPGSVRWMSLEFDPRCSTTQQVRFGIIGVVEIQFYLFTWFFVIYVQLSESIV
jgi:E3 ubiquitin-protein ligase MYCBP2